MIGLNFPADGRVNPQFGALLGAKWLRVVLKPDVDLTDWIARTHARGIQVLGLIARESLSGSYNDTAQMYSDRYGNSLDALQCGNEADHESPSSWTMTPDDLNSLLAAFNMHFGLAEIVGPGLVSGHPEYLDNVDLDLLDGIAVHPYGQRPNNVEDWAELPGNFGSVAGLLDSYRYHEKPIWVTEVGVSTKECTEAFQARYCEAILKSLSLRSDVPAAFWFCADDQMVPEFGLYGYHDNPKPSAAAFMRAAKEQPLPAPNYTVGPGVLAKMTEDHTEPGSDECYYPVGVKPSQWSETMAKNGTIYRYLFATNETYRFPADPA